MLFALLSAIAITMVSVLPALQPSFSRAHMGWTRALHYAIQFPIDWVPDW